MDRGPETTSQERMRCPQLLKRLSLKPLDFPSGHHYFPLPVLVCPRLESFKAYEASGPAGACAP